MGITDEHVKPIASRLSRLQWVAASAVLGFFLGFVDTLLIACVLGYLGLRVPAYFGVPTSFVGYFCTGLVVGNLAGPEIVWEVAAGILLCVLLLIWGLAGTHGLSVPYLLLNYVCVPGIAIGTCYLGLRVGRTRAAKKLQRELSKETFAG